MSHAYLDGKFGMYEMESAADLIIAKAKQYGTRSPKMYYTAFTDEDLMTGYLHLIYGGFMDVGEYNGEFIPNGEFWNRIPKEYHP